MDVFEEIADERRALADQLATLTLEQQTTRSLCHAWSVHDVLAHLVMPLEVSTSRLVLAVLLAGGKFDRASERVTRQLAQRPFAELVEVLRRKADIRFTPPGSGPESPLVDVLVHGLDIRWPLRLHHDIPAPRLREALTFLMTAPAGLVPRGALTGLRLEAEDIDWAHGSGPVVRGRAGTLLLAATGRTAALAPLTGDGAPVLRGRLAAR
ncbi:maleylpyruvate isomerase family mycothiol-dependent enzyme [Motilibacter aurantiacus]|uniref:maleylpyruvate isomerase family mycothiol-dependent enzyme n=1 Tax=Motilibacter aurantiacus TaxID=2714955 RepID=UPI00140D3D22|nr:maleylpyruvate isomerase family mycothiol-dependent enzyme [Motilibacter aurantiacus]